MHTVAELNLPHALGARKHHSSHAYMYTYEYKPPSLQKPHGTTWALDRSGWRAGDRDQHYFQPPLWPKDLKPPATSLR